jgi:predicted nucleic-acid-binding Zn-ribbon protein
MKVEYETYIEIDIILICDFIYFRVINIENNKYLIVMCKFDLI